MQEEEAVNLDTSNETVEEEAVETQADETTTEESTETKEEVDVEQLQATNKKLYERAKKAEAEAKVLRSQKPVEANPTNVEETVLLANGMSEELLGELKAVAKVRGTTLLKAQADPIFVAVKEKFEKDQKQKEASLRGSRGSGSVKAAKTFTTPGLSREDHRKMVLESR